MSSARAIWAFAGALLPLLFLDRWGSAAWLEPVSRAALAWMVVVLVAGVSGGSRSSDRLGWLLLGPLLIACAAVDRSLGQSPALLAGVAGLGAAVAFSGAEAGRRFTANDVPARSRARWLWTAGWWAWLLVAPALWMALQRTGAQLEGTWLAAAPMVRLGEWARIGETSGVGWAEVARGVGLAGAPLLLWAVVCGAVSSGAPDHEGPDLKDPAPKNPAPKNPAPKNPAPKNPAPKNSVTVDSGAGRTDVGGGNGAGRGRGGAVASVLGAWLLGAFGEPAVAQESRLARVTVEVEGPLKGLDFEVRGGGWARYSVDLEAGERRELELFVPVRSALEVSLARPPAGTARGGGRVEAVRWASEPVGEAFWKSLPVGLRARPRPVPLDRRGAAPGWLIAGLVGLFLPGWWLVRRGQRGASRAVGALGLILAGAAWSRLADEPGAAGVEALEADLRGVGSGLRIRSAARMKLSSARLLGEGRLETVPEGAELQIAGSVDPATGRVRLEAEAPGAVLHWLMPIGSGTLAELAERFEGSGVGATPALGLERRVAFRREGGVDRPVPVADLPPWLVGGLPAGLPVAFWVEPSPGEERRFTRLLGPGESGD